MGFHKGNFIIQNIPNAPTVIDVVSGWIDESNTYGFYKYNKVWKATDLMSGTLITTLPTRKACVEYIEANKERLTQIRETQKYRIKVDDFYNAIKKELKKMKQKGLQKNVLKEAAPPCNKLQVSYNLLEGGETLIGGNYEC